MKKLILHPLLFALFPVLAIYSRNKDMAQFSYILRPIFVSVIFAVVVFAIVYIFVRRPLPTAIIATLVLALFFSFGHIYPLIPDYRIGAFLIPDYATLMVAWLVLFVSITALTATTSKPLTALNEYLNYFSLILVAIPIITVSRLLSAHRQPVANPGRRTRFKRGPTGRRCPGHLLYHPGRLRARGRA